LSPLPSCLSSLPTSFLLDFLPHFAHREVESEREDEGREEQGNAVPPQTRATLFVGFEHEHPHHDVDHHKRNHEAARTAAHRHAKRLTSNGQSHNSQA
ncbi:MAG: hypothetical protein ACK55Z_04865, partial [bacterium]